MTLNETIVDEEFINRMEEFRKTPEGVGLIEACSDNIVLFSSHMLGIRLYSWQIYFLNRIIKHSEFNREFLALTSRQIGKSTLVAIYCLWCTLFNKYPGGIHANTIPGIISASDVQAKKLLYEMKKFMRSGDAYMNEQYKDAEGKPKFGESFFTSLLDESEPNNTTTISFKKYSKKHGKFLLNDSKIGSVIKSYPPTSAVLGETFTIVIEDEAGKSDKITDQFHYDYAYPTGNSTNAIRIYTSTPWTPSGFFYRLADPFGEYGESSCDRVLFTIEAIRIENPEYYATVMKVINQMNADGKTAEVQRAYYCRFVKGEKNYFNPDKIFDMEDIKLSMLENYSGDCDLGVDFGGQVTSRTVLTVSKLDEDGKIVRLYHRSYEVGKDDNLIEDIEELKTRFNIQRIIPDECPQGDYMIRTMIDKGWDVQPMNFRTDKTKKYGAFRSKLNKSFISSYKDDDLKVEMLAMEFSQGSRQSLIMAAPGYNDDLIDSFVLSSYFFLEEDDKFNFHNWDEVEDIDIPY